MEALSESEWQVLLKLDSDLTEKQIAATFEGSPHTLHSYIKNIYKKLKVGTRLGAIKLLNRLERNAYLEELRNLSSQAPRGDDSFMSIPVANPRKDALSLLKEAQDVNPLIHP
jgi:DNA-binding CsgD family transcriptional regulator